MQKAEPGMTKRALVALVLLLAVSLALLTGCDSKKLADQNDGQIGAIVESIQSSFAEPGWEYTGFELLEKNKDNDTATVDIAYNVEGDAAELLKAHATEKPKDESVYALAENVNVKQTIEMSAYDKDNDALGCELLSTTWYVGDTEANEWIKGHNES